MEDFIEWLENNPNLIIDKANNNISTFEELEAEVVIENKILCPSTALQLATIFEEYLNTSCFLILYEGKVKLPSDVKEKLIESVFKGLCKLKDLADVEAKNNGNLNLFINAITEEKPIPNVVDSVNITENMIDVDFKSYEEGVV